MYKITKEQFKTYEEEGYLILKNVLDTAPIERLSDFVAHVISLEAKNLVRNKNFSRDEILNEVLISLKREHPSSSAWIYHTILTSYALKKFFIDIDVASLAMQLLGIHDINNLGTVSPAFRFDIPGDKRNTRTWHQDSNYFLENKKGTEHLVAWIPINDAYKNNGSVVMAPRTHKNGRLKSQHEKGQTFTSEQYTTPDEYFEDAHLEYVEASPGDIAFINMDLIHSSGVNITTNSVRYTAQIRFNTINLDEYRPVKLMPEYPTYDRL